MLDENTMLVFLSKIARVDDATSCWMWLGRKNAAGYGVFSFRGTQKLAHRISLEIALGAPLGELCALHRCDTPGCVRWSHLFPGTHADNCRDKIAKGRMRWGTFNSEDHPRAKMKNADVILARNRYEAGERLEDIAVDYGVSATSIWGAVRGFSWKKLVDSDGKGAVTRRRTKLSKEVISTLAARNEAGESQAALAREYGIARSAVHSAIHGKSWVGCAPAIPKNETPRKRAPRGENSSRSKLTDVIVREIRSSYAAGELRAAIARRFNVSIVTICNVISGISWKHVVE